VDPTHQGSISASVAAKFLKKSGLSDIILSKVNIISLYLKYFIFAWKLYFW
jgi:hypothetical protein